MDNEKDSLRLKSATELLKQAHEHLTFAKACGSIVIFDPVSIEETVRGIEMFLTEPNKDWIIKRIPNTRDEYYVESGRPPKEVLEIYGLSN